MRTGDAARLAVVLLLVTGACTRESEAPPRGPATPLDHSTTGVISGTVRFDGKAPAANEIRMSGDAACRPDDAGPSSDVLVRDGRVENAFVYLKEGLGDRVFELPEPAVEIDQSGCIYRPHVVGLQTGQELRFVNSDPTLHNVHTVPVHSRGVNFGMGVKGSKRSIRVETTEIMMTVKCDVHPWMRAYVGVLDHPYFAVTGSDGSFRLADVPPGDYVVEAWHERFGTRTATVTITPKAEAPLDFRFAED